MSIIGYIKSHRSFAYLTSGIYVCFIISALLHERMYACVNSQAQEAIPKHVDIAE